MKTEQLENQHIAITYSQITPESAEQGDFSDSGWVNEKGVYMVPDDIDIEEGLTAVDLAVKYLKREGATEASSSSFHSGIWYSTGFHTEDYRTGTEEERSYHPKTLDGGNIPNWPKLIHPDWTARRKNW